MPMTMKCESVERWRPYRGTPVLWCVGWALVLSTGCVVNPVCFSDADCPGNRVCIMSGTEGTCEPRCADDKDCADGQICGDRAICTQAECAQDEDCDEGYACDSGRCRSVQELECPSDMAVVDGAFCMDRYEASRKDATMESAGEDDTMAHSRPGVIPWQVADNAAATAACQAAGKSLCTADQWYRACSNGQSDTYSYGDAYDPVACNGIDTFCHCDSGVCETSSPCPYAHCYSTCGATFHITPTGQFADCVNIDGIFDLNGNLWEHVAGGTDMTVRGGAFNCSNSERLHQCTYVPGSWAPSARGFRCCSAGNAGSSVNEDTDLTEDTSQGVAQ